MNLIKRLHRLAMQSRGTQPHRCSMPRRFRPGPVAVAFIACPMLATASDAPLPPCGKNVVPVNSGTSDFYPAPACGERGSFKGIVSLSIVVNPDGTLKFARVVGSTMTPSASAQCAEIQAAKFAKLLRFTAPSTACKMIFPMKLDVSTAQVKDLS